MSIGRSSVTKLAALWATTTLTGASGCSEPEPGKRAAVLTNTASFILFVERIGYGRSVRIAPQVGQAKAVEVNRFGRIVENLPVPVVEERFLPAVVFVPFE